VASAQSALDKITTVWIKMEIESRRFKYLKYVYVHIFQCASSISLLLYIIRQSFNQSIISQSISQLVNQSVSQSVGRQSFILLVSQAHVVQTLDSAICRINHYPVDKY